MKMIENRALRLMRDGGLALGFGVHHLRTSATAAIAAVTDHDWLFIDMEHGAFSLDDTAQICLAALPTGITPLVRVAKTALDEGTRALDNGAQGIVVPHVDTAESAAEIAHAFRYPPIGARSWGGPHAIFNYAPPSHAEAQRLANADIAVICMIESPEGLANADAIAATPGVDVLMIGTSDLSAELGVAGQIGHEKVQEAYRIVSEACRRHGKILGMGGVYDSEWAGRYMAAGARFVLAGSDQNYLMAGGQARTRAVREAFASGSS